MYIFIVIYIYMIFNNSQTTTLSSQLQPEAFHQPLDQAVHHQSHKDGGPRLHGEQTAIQPLQMLLLLPGGHGGDP